MRKIVGISIVVGAVTGLLGGAIARLVRAGDGTVMIAIAAAAAAAGVVSAMMIARRGRYSN